ncbi:MAG: 1-(5-phosphoribosyl)-5-[(5-phosphoribosylamino)methylideneamino]imidazole-4-carboxamide isomerase [Oscillospiraceae bacterium]
MDLYPAIDLRNGKAVRLLRGNYDDMTVYSDSPLEVAKAFKAAGAKYLHLVDLDGAKDGDTPNFEIISEITAKSGLIVEVGGGVRNMHTVERYLNNGVSRVIIGTAAITNPEFLREAVERFGKRIAVGVDIKDGLVATHGWTRTSTEDCFTFCTNLQKMGVRCIICTDISKDGAMQGVNAELYERLSSQFKIDIIASGGVTNMDDLVRLSKIGISGAILGKSLYTGSIDLAAAIRLMANLNK